MVMEARRSSKTDLVGKVLYIEDNPVNILVMQQWASRFPGLRFEVAETGSEGVERFQRFRPDVVLLDMQLPDCDGIEVLRRLRTLPPDSWVPVAMVTAFSAETDRRRALDAGAAAYWLKPVDFNHLERELSTLLPRGAERRQ